MDLSTHFAGVRLEHPLMNAAGTVKTLEDVKRIAPSACAAVVLGSITMEARAGNEGEVFWNFPPWTLNSLGLPNPGSEYLRRHLPEMVAICHGHGKPLIVSVAGFTPDEYAQLTEIAFAGGADVVEENFGCPNLWTRGGQKRITCFDRDAFPESLLRIAIRVGAEKPITAKLSPFSDPYALGETAALIADHPVIKAVVSMNTFPNAFALDMTGKPHITPGGGLAGLSGDAVLPIGLGQVRQLRALLPAQTQIIGVGGIGQAWDIVQYLQTGAEAVQIATAYLRSSERIFESWLAELVDLADG